MSGTMEHYPVLPTEATHVVTVNSRLALRDAPAYLASSNLASEDNHIKGEIIDMMPNGTRLIVLDEGVGYECEWAQVLVEGATYPQGSQMWTSTKYIAKLGGTAESAPMECSEKAWGNPRAIPLVEWASKSPSEVFFDEHDARYKVCIEMSEEEYTSTGGEEIMTRLREATVHGLRYILRFNGKNSEDDYITELMDGTDSSWFQFVRATEYHVDTKPNSYLKVLVELPHRYVPPLEDAKGVVATSAGRSLVAWDATERVRIRSTYSTIEFKDCCEKLALLLEEYAVDIDAYDGTVNDFDPRAEAERIRQVSGVLDVLFRTNDITHDTWSKREVLEIGWDATLTPVFIALTLVDGRVIAMGAGMDEYADTPPIDSQRTQGYIWQLNLLCKAKYADRPWVEFVKAFTLPDAPTIIPGAPGEDSPGDITDVEDPASAEAKKSDELPIKTYPEKLLEDRKLGDPDFKSKLYEARKDAHEFVGAAVASCEGLQKTLDKISTVDDAFGEVLDKISIADLIQQCLSAIAPELSSISDISSDISGGLDGVDLGSGIGVGDIPDVGVDYDWSNPSIPGMNTNMELANMGSMSVDSLGLGDVSFGDLGLGSMSIADLGISDFTLGSLGIGDIGVCDMAGIANKTIGELGVNLDSIGIFDKSFADLDFGVLTVGDLDLDLSSLSIADIGWSDVRISNVGLDIEDLGLNNLDVESMGHDLSTLDSSHLTFAELGKENAIIGEEGFELDDVGMAKINLSGYNVGELDLNLDALPVVGCGCDTTIGSLGLDDFSLGSLGLDSFNIGELGLDGINMSDLGLANLDMDALGLSGADLAGLKGKFEELGLDGVVGELENLGIDSLGVDMESIEGLSTEFTQEFDAAMGKLEDMAGSLSVGENPFEQGAPKLIADLAITLADNLPTEDIMGSMSEMIEDALTMFLQELFVAMVKAVLEQMLENCGENPTQAGKENLNDMLDSSPNNTGLADPLAGLMAALGTGLSGAGAAAARRNPNSEAARAAVTPEVRREMTAMLDDVSLMFTPMELCSLINGKASSKVVLLARNFIAKRYPDMGLSTRTKTSDFFKAFGGLIDPSICRIIETPLTTSQGPILGDVMCSSGDMRDLRKEMLRNKGDDITDDQIDAILDNLKQRKVNAAKVLIDIVNNGPLSDNYEPPPVTCQKNATPKNAATPNNAAANNVPGMDTQGGLVNLEHESIDFAVDTASENLFVPVEISYSREMKMYPKTYVSDTNKEEPDNTYIWMNTDETGDGDEKKFDWEKAILNPELKAEFGDKDMFFKWADNADVDYTSKDAYVARNKKVRKALPPLHQALKQMETNDSLVFKDFAADSILFEPVNVEGIADDFPFDNGGYGVELVLPRMGENDIAEISSALSGVGDADIDADTRTKINDLMNQMSSATPTWKLFYILPKLFISEVQDGTNINTFLMVVTETLTLNGVSSERVVYRAVSTTSPDEAVLGVLESDEFELHDQVYETDASASAPQQRFASLVYNRWMDAGASISHVHLVYAACASTDGYYSELSRDIFAYIANRIAAGPYFQNITSSSASGRSGTNSSTPVVEFLELDPEPTAQQQVDGVSPHPLGLQQKKKCMKENIKNNQCVDFSRPTDGSPAADLSDTEKELMKVAVETIVQTYMADHYLRGLFSNSIFKMPDEPDEAYINHVAGFILADMAAYDMPNYVTMPTGERKAARPHGTYMDDFIAECVRMYEKPDDVEIQDPEVPGGEVSEVMAVGQQIEKAYSTVMTQMENLVAASDTTDIEEMFLNDYLPEISIADYGKMGNKFFMKGGADLSKSHKGAAEGGSTVTLGDETVVTYASNASSLSLRTEGFADDTSDYADRLSGSETTTSVDGRQLSDIDWSNGNLYVEYYYLLEDWDTKPSWWDDSMGETEKWSGRGHAYSDDSDASYYRYYGVVSDEDYAALDNDLPEDVTMNGMSGMTIDIDGGEVKSAVRAVKRGMRIMYLPPTTETNLIPVTLSQTDASVGASAGAFADFDPTDAEKFDAAWEASMSYSMDEAFNTAANGDFNMVTGASATPDGSGETVRLGLTKETAIKTKAFKVLETVRSSSTLKFGTANSAGTGWQSGTGVAKAYLIKETNPVPILDYNFSMSPIGFIGPDVSFEDSPASVSVTDLQASMLASDEWKAFIKYIFPISRMQSILSLYCFQATSSKQEVATAMTDTKDRLRTVFFAINSKGDYKQKDPALEAVGGLAGLEKMMQNEFGLKDMPVGDSSWNYNMPVGWGQPVKGLGLELLAKATAEALQKMFKRWAEKHDPNISLAHKLMMVSKMGGVNINTLAWSFMILPANIFPFAPIGPILGPVSIIYHALGLGLFKRTKDGDGDQADETNSQLSALGVGQPVSLTPPDTCEEDSTDGSSEWDAQQGTLSYDLSNAWVQQNVSNFSLPDSFIDGGAVDWSAPDGSEGIDLSGATITLKLKDSDTIPEFKPITVVLKDED